MKILSHGNFPLYGMLDLVLLVLCVHIRKCKMCSFTFVGCCEKSQQFVGSHVFSIIQPVLVLSTLTQHW